MVEVRLLTLGDLHGHVEWTPRLEQEASAADAVVLCGDLTQFGRPEDADLMIDQVLDRCERVLAVAGNCDSHAIVRHLDERGISLHGRGVFLEEGIALCGVSGSDATPFGTPLEYDPETLADILAAGWEEIHDASVRIVVHHAPPWGTVCDLTSSGTHVGMRGLREFCERERPELVVCGHIHEARGSDSIGATRVVNGGMAARGHGVVVTVADGGLEVELV